ncbi:MAG: DUF4444 domain-containing protein [Alphaproteobacteria bacterium]|nr:DUF4444 domain-containing protein [Alphaproteobacteria bacterium]NNF24938.1 DUF4444 domain-containing protein [Paracoccaceae bacterium]
MTQLQLPPLLAGQQAPDGKDPFDHARQLAAEGCDAGTIVYDLGATVLRASLIVAPEEPLAGAAVILPVCAIGFQNALGALAPPEVAVQLTWDGKILINGGVCGAFRIAASTQDPAEIPGWMVAGFRLTLWPENEDTGLTPDQTALYSEGCAEVAAPDLLEAWARHTLVWINRWTEDGPASLHREWEGLVPSIGEEITLPQGTGTFLGVDERFGLLLRTGGGTDLVPLTALLEERR